MKPPPGQCWQFRDQKVPARLIQLLKEEKLNGKDLLLMFVIDALVRPHASKQGLGCYASNEYLSEAINTHQNHVPRKLKKLLEMGLVVEVWMGNQRYLELQWSRTEEEMSEMTDEYGVLLRAAHETLRLTLNKNVKPPLNINVKPPLNKNVNQYSNVEVLSSIEKEGGYLAAPQPPLPTVKKKLKPKLDTPQFCITWATDLHHFLQNITPPIQVLPSSVRKRSERFYKLYKSLGADDTTEERITTVISWYTDNFYIQRYKLPRIESVYQFCDRFNWIEDRMKLATRSTDYVTPPEEEDVIN